jgi:hypothetical protein
MNLNGSSYLNAARLNAARQKPTQKVTQTLTKTLINRQHSQLYFGRQHSQLYFGETLNFINNSAYNQLDTLLTKAMTQSTGQLQQTINQRFDQLIQLLTPVNPPYKEC